MINLDCHIPGTKTVVQGSQLEDKKCAHRKCHLTFQSFPMHIHEDGYIW